LFPGVPGTQIAFKHSLNIQTDSPVFRPYQNKNRFCYGVNEILNPPVSNLVYPEAVRWNTDTCALIKYTGKKAPFFCRVKRRTGFVVIKNSFAVPTPCVAITG
jgi:hypothetical protein